MERTPVKSTNVASVGYNEQTNTLEIAFRSGAIYQYAGVEPQTHTELLGAESIGRFVNQNIVGGGFKGERVDQKEK